MNLDRVANDLERVKQYALADEVRESARDLRLLARQLDLVARFATVQNGRLTLHGSFEFLAGIEVLSKGGHLSLETSPDFQGMQLKKPFNPGDGIVVRNSPDAVVIGVLGAGRRIYVEGEIATSVLYSASEKVALSDLTVNIGLGDDPPTRIPVRSVEAPNQP